MWCGQLLRIWTAIHCWENPFTSGKKSSRKTRLLDETPEVDDKAMKTIYSAKPRRKWVISLDEIGTASTTMSHSCRVTSLVKQQPQPLHDEKPWLNAFFNDFECFMLGLLQWAETKFPVVKGTHGQPSLVGMKLRYFPLSSRHWNIWRGEQKLSMAFDLGECRISLVKIHCTFLELDFCYDFNEFLVPHSWNNVYANNICHEHPKLLGDDVVLWKPDHIGLFYSKISIFGGSRW